MKGFAVLESIAQFLKLTQELSGLGLLKPGDDLWTILFGRLETSNPPHEAKMQRVA